MIHKIFSVFDSKAAAYTLPYFAPTQGVAVRQFTAAAQAADHDFHKFSEDYTLYYLGEFDDASGSFLVNENPSVVLTASAAIQKEQ